MISNISFGSTFKVSNKNNNYDKFSKFQTFALNKERYDGINTRFEDSFNNFPKEYHAEYTMIAPDSMDNEIETYCANFGIEYKKIPTQELLEYSSILSRIDEASGYNKSIAYVDVKKLEELIENQDSNIKHCQKDYSLYYRYDVDSMLKSGEKIPATCLTIVDPYNNTEDTVDYIKKYGADKLNKGQFFIDFTQATDQPDHCVYFALRDLGMEKVPVCVDRNTRAIGKALGLFE